MILENDFAKKINTVLISVWKMWVYCFEKIFVCFSFTSGSVEDFEEFFVVEMEHCGSPYRV